MYEHRKQIAIISDQIDQDFEKACAIIQKEGYTFIELHNVFGKSIEQCNEEEIKKIKEIITQHKLKVVNIASTIFFLCPLYDHYRVSLFNPEFHAIEGKLEDHLLYLHNACRIAQDLSCETIRIFPFRFPDNEEIEVVGSDEDMINIVENLKKAVAIAKQYDVTLALENCPYSHCPKAEMTYHLIQEVNDSHLKLLWDPANSFRAEEHRVPEKYKHLTLSEEYQLIKKDIRHVHLKNYQKDTSNIKPFQHRALFHGDIGYTQLLQELMKDYPYYCSLEAEVDFDETIQSMRELKHFSEHDMNTGFSIQADIEQLDFIYGNDVYGPTTEKRKLDDVRKSLSDPHVEGPTYIYAVAMDVAKKQHQEDLIQRNLLYGAMIFSQGRIGEEPVRSQGHIHAISTSCNASTCEVYEIWSGEAYIYMQESAKDHPGKCYAIHAVSGDVVIVPPNWAHATINANPSIPMLFGAWCVRDYGFEYEDVRAHQGLAYYPKYLRNTITFHKNNTYKSEDIIVKEARTYPEFNITYGVPIYTQYEMDKNRFNFVTNPRIASKLWDSFEP